MAAVQQLTVTLTRASGATENVTASASYVSATPAVATVSTGGLITAVGAGTSTVTASHLGVSGTCAVTVTDPAEGLAVSPTTAALDIE